MRIVAVATCLAVLAPGVTTAAAKTVRLYVFGRTQAALDKAAQEARAAQTEAEHKRLEEARKQLGKTLEAKHGKKEWPPDAVAQFTQARQAELMALLAHHEGKVEQKDIDDSVQDVIKALRDELKKNPPATLVDKPEEADLTVELLARRAKTSYPAAAFVLYLKLTPVGWKNSDAIAATQLGQVKDKDAFIGLLGFTKLRGDVTTAHPFSSPEPYWIIEVYQQGSSYRHPAWTFAEALVGLCSGLLRLDDGAAAP